MDYNTASNIIEESFFSDSKEINIFLNNYNLT